MYVNTQKANHLFKDGKGWEFPVFNRSFGRDSKSLYFTFCYRSAVPLAGAGGYWNAGIGNANGEPAVQEIWIGFLKQDRENSALGAKIIAVELFGAKVGALFTLPIFGMLASKRTGSTAYGVTLILSRGFSL